MFPYKRVIFRIPTFQFSDIEAVEAEFEPDFDCEEPGFNPDPDYCMRYYRCDQNLEVK